MAHIVTPRRTEVQNGGYVHEYCWRSNPDAGFSFPCDETGQVLLNEMQEAGRENWRKVQSGEYDVIDQGVRHDTWDVRVAALLECDCGEQFYLEDGFVNSCPNCWREYNGYGQQLAPRRQWGDETGESLADIFSRYDPEEVG